MELSYGTTIKILRSMVPQKQEFRELLGRENFLDLYKRYKNYGSRAIPSVTNPDKKIALGDIQFRDTIKGKCVSITPCSEDFTLQKSNMTFYGNDISWTNIVKRVQDWEQKAAAQLKIPRSIEELKPKSLNKLFSAKYNPTRRVDEFGNPITTIIDKKTQEPVEAYVILNKLKNNVEQITMGVKNAQGEREYIGYRTYQLDPERKILTPGNMEAYANDRYEGIGSRLHQIAIERMMQNDYKAVTICSTDRAFPFHYKSLFRTEPHPECNFDEAASKDMKDKISRMIKNFDIKEEEINNCFARAEDNKYDFSKTVENIHKMFFKHRISAGGDTPMILDGKNLEYWKSLIAKQPILLGLDS